jgi:hypothetical protein
MSMTLVSTVTVGSGGAASIDFNSIPQTGTDLFAVCSLRSTGGGIETDLFIYVNGSITQTGRWLLGDGSAASSASPSSNSARITGASATSNTFGNASVYFTNYTAATNKSFSVDAVTENNATNATQIIAAKSRADTNPITSLSFTDLGTLAQHSTVSLYLVTKGSGGATTSP